MLGTRDFTSVLLIFCGVRLRAIFEIFSQNAALIARESSRDVDCAKFSFVGFEMLTGLLHASFCRKIHLFVRRKRCLRKEAVCTVQLDSQILKSDISSI